MPLNYTTYTLIILSAEITRPQLFQLNSYKVWTPMNIMENKVNIIQPPKKLILYPKNKHVFTVILVSCEVCQAYHKQMFI